MKLYFYFLVLFLACCYSEAKAQSGMIQLPPGYNKIYYTDRIPGDVVGSPYLWEDWIKCSVSFRNGQILQDVAMRYNVYKGEMQYKTGKGIFIIGAPDSILSLKFSDRTFIYTKFDENNSQKKDYFEVVSDGKAQILVRHMMQIIKSNYNVALDVGEKNDHLRLKEVYYVKKDNLVAEVDKKGKTLLNLLADKSVQLSDFIKKNHPSFKDKADLCRVTEYYNSL